MGVDVCLHCMFCVNPQHPRPLAPSRMARVLSVTEAVVDSSRW